MLTKKFWLKQRMDLGSVPTNKKLEFNAEVVVVYKRISASQMDALWELQRLYKNAIGEDEPEA